VPSQARSSWTSSPQCRPGDRERAVSAGQPVGDGPSICRSRSLDPLVRMNGGSWSQADLVIPTAKS
jgi:hypothetical protein